MSLNPRGMFPRLLLILLTFSATCAALGFERPHYWGYGAIDIAALPQEAQFTLALIKRGGPFPYRKDGATFQNRERLLPKRARGYYREYTVRTPGSSDRGGRRIVAGEDGELYYTDDHYRTFRRIRE